MYPKVLMVVPYFLPIMSGVTLYAYRLAKGLQENGLDVCIHTIAYKADDEEIQNPDTSGLNIIRFKYQWDNRKFCQPISWSYVLKTLMDSNKYDIIHVHDFPKITNDAIIFILKKILKRRIPIVLTPHGSGYVGPTMSKISKLYWAVGIPYSSLMVADCIITGTKLQYDSFKQKFGLSKVTLIPTGILTNDYYATSKISTKIGSLNVLYIGRIIREKGLQYLLEAMNIVRQSVKLKLVCVGPDYGFRNELEKKANQLGISDLVYFTGKVPESEKLKYLRWCDVLVLPSHYEAFGIPIIEAMAHGKAVIATATEGAKSLIEHRKNGLLVGIGNVSELASSLKELANNPDLREALGKAGYKTAEDYKLETFIKRHIELYQKMV